MAIDTATGRASSARPGLLGVIITATIVPRAAVHAFAIAAVGLIEGRDHVCHG
jgi:hypothetical protein